MGWDTPSDHSNEMHTYVQKKKKFPYLFNVYYYMDDLSIALSVLHGLLCE